MKKIILSAIAVVFLFTLTKCKGPILCVSFEIFSFQETYSRHIQNENTFFVKGIALGTNRHGREIRVIEDLKGNFRGNNAFVWGASSTSSCSRPGQYRNKRVDFINHYQRGDTLIMLLTQARERSRDFATFGYGHSSVVRLSNGYVSGLITYPWIETMSLEEFQALFKFN